MEKNKSELTKTAMLSKEALTSVDAGVGGWDTELWLNKLWNEGDEGGDDGTLRRVGQADKQEGHVAEDPQRCLREVWGRIQAVMQLTHDQSLNLLLTPTQTKSSWESLLGSCN